MAVIQDLPKSSRVLISGFKGKKVQIRVQFPTYGKFRVEGEAQTLFDGDALVVKPIMSSELPPNIKISGNICGGFVNIGGSVSFGGNTTITGGRNEQIKVTVPAGTIVEREDSDNVEVEGVLMIDKVITTTYDED